MFALPNICSLKLELNQLSSYLITCADFLYVSLITLENIELCTALRCSNDSTFKPQD